MAVELIKERGVNFIESEEGKIFYYVDYGNGMHGKISFRLWISPHCISNDEGRLVVKFPCNCKIVKKKKAWVLIPDINYWTIDLLVHSGYRGGGWIEEFLYPNLEELIIAKYEEYHSPRGNLGVDTGYLISIPEKYKHIKIKWKRDGRTYGGEKEGIIVIDRNGNLKEGIDDEIKEFIIANTQMREDNNIKKIQEMMNILAHPLSL